MLTFLLLLQAATAASQPAPEAPAPTTSTMLARCAAGVGGDMIARGQCEAAVLEAADADRIDPQAPPPGGCLSTPARNVQDLVWAYLQWANEHPGEGAKPASSTITAAMLENLPCGWRTE